MTANERRAEIMRLLVTRRTICTDIETLTLDYPLESTMGRNGGVRLPEWYHPHRNILSAEQQTVLSQLMESANERQREVLAQMLVEYGSPKTRQMMNGGMNAG